MASGFRRRAFTVTELLVTIGVLAILAGLVFPVLASMRNAARRSGCQSQLRQLGQAFRMYLEDWNGSEPIWLSATLPYVRTRTLFLCPNDATAGLHMDTEHRLDPYRDPHLQVSYFYEFNPLPYPPDFPPYPGLRPGTSFRLIRQAEHRQLGDAVLIARCWWHSRLTREGGVGWVFNLTYGGWLTKSPRNWPHVQQKL